MKKRTNSILVAISIILLGSHSPTATQEHGVKKA